MLPGRTFFATFVDFFGVSTKNGKFHWQSSLYNRGFSRLKYTRKTWTGRARPGQALNHSSLIPKIFKEMCTEEVTYAKYVAFTP